MIHIIVLLAALVLMPSFAQAESIPEAVRRIDAKLQGLERAGVGKPGGATGAPRSPRPCRTKGGRVRAHANLPSRLSIPIMEVPLAVPTMVTQPAAM